MIEKKWVVYLVQCSDKSLYCGITNNLKKRLAAHNSGRGAKYTKSRRPVRLLSVSSKLTKSDALKLEYGVKRVPAGEKQNELAKGEGTLTINAMAEVRTIKKELKMLSKRVEKLRISVENIERYKVLV
jgi:putative endonuclease